MSTYPKYYRKGEPGPTGYTVLKATSDSEQISITRIAMGNREGLELYDFIISSSVIPHQVLATYYQPSNVQEFAFALGIAMGCLGREAEAFYPKQEKEQIDQPIG
ncbi:MAG: hypothetical protein V4543_00790 [Bacteroidota bacterium]